MRGTDKQIKWAEDIKAAMSWENVKDAPIVTKAKAMIMDNDDAAWWINVAQNYNGSGYAMIKAMLTGGLVICLRGSQKVATLRRDGSAIDIKWSEIVSDGAGGHKEERAKTISA